MILTRKLKLTIIGETPEERNKKYKFIRDAQYAQYRGLNYLMSQLVTLFYSCHMDIKSEEFKQGQKMILSNSNNILKDIEFGTGIDTCSLITRKVSQDFWLSVKNGLAKGERSTTYYKRTTPLLTRKERIIFRSDLPMEEVTHDMVLDKDFNLYIKWAHKILFKVILGNPYRSHYLREELWKIFQGEYKICESSLMFDKNNNLILNLSMDIPKKENPVNEKNILGVRLGYMQPVTAAIYETKETFNVGSTKDFILQRKAIREKRRELQKSLVMAHGGHGRKRKLEAMNKLKEREKNFARTYNHQLSYRIVELARKNYCSCIVLEDISNIYDINNIVLSYWGYYQL